MQARKESLWRNLLGVAYALTVVLTPGEGQLSIGLVLQSRFVTRRLDDHDVPDVSR
jgi:hypothetical protein